MGNEHSPGATGYAVLDLRISELEKDMKDVELDLKEHIQKNDDEHKEMRASIAESALSLREIKIMFAQIVTSSDEMKSDIRELGKANNKEKGWRAIIMDILKVILLILGFIATGKFVL